MVVFATILSSRWRKVYTCIGGLWRRPGLRMRFGFAGKRIGGLTIAKCISISIDILHFSFINGWANLTVK